MSHNNPSHMPLRILHAVLIAIVIARPAKAEPTYEEWAETGKQAYLAFRCAALASTAGMPAEFGRLFNKGVDLGRPLLNAVFEGRVTPRNDRWIMPLGALACSNGPSAEFVLGRIFQCAWQDSHLFIDAELDPQKRAAEARRGYERDRCGAN